MHRNFAWPAWTRGCLFVNRRKRAPNASVLFDKFHMLRPLGEALDKARKTEYARLTGKERKFIKGEGFRTPPLMRRRGLDAGPAFESLPWTKPRAG